MSTIEKSRRQLFVEELESKGIFVRTYDEPGMNRLFQAASDLHRELCKYDNTNVQLWSGVTVIELVDAYAKHQDLAVLGDRVGRCPGDKLGDTCPGLKSGVSSDCPHWNGGEDGRVP